MNNDNIDLKQAPRKFCELKLHRSDADQALLGWSLDQKIQQKCCEIKTNGHLFGDGTLTTHVIFIPFRKDPSKLLLKGYTTSTFLLYI